MKTDATKRPPPSLPPPAPAPQAPASPPPVVLKGRAKYIQVRAEDAQALRKFLSDMETKFRASRETCATHSAFLHLADGRVLQVDITIPLPEK
jgi:hypothetical protein